MFSADCAEAKTLSPAHIHGHEIRCVIQVSHEYSRVHELSQASIYCLNYRCKLHLKLKEYCTLKNNSHRIRVLHYCCLLLAASMATTIEQYWSRIACHNNFDKAKDALRVRGILEYDAYDVLLKCVLPANIKRLCWTLQVVE